MCTLTKKLLQRQKAGNLRSLKLISNQIDFASNDYLGLARSDCLKADFAKEWERTRGLGSTGSRLLTGNSSYAETLENEIAVFHGFAAGFLFGSGYMANVGLFRAIAGESDTIFFDAHIHASMRDGITLSQAKALPFRHSDLAHLEKRLDESSSKGNYIVVESIYSTDGSKAPLKEIINLGKIYDARVIVDEAHAIGVVGPEGRGLVAEMNLCSEVFALVAPFGKALGVYGAIVLGSALLKEALINFATSSIYTTALPFYNLAAIKCSYALFPKLDKERELLNLLVQRFKSGTHIQPIQCVGNKSVKEASGMLLQKGFDVRPLMSPTVRRGEEILRISLHVFNKIEELDALLDTLTTYGVLHG